MMLGEDRFAEAADELARIVQEELAGFGLPAELDDVARVLGTTSEDLERPHAVADGAWLEARVERWNTFADVNGLPHLVAVDHGDEVELLIGRVLASVT